MVKLEEMSDYEKIVARMSVLELQIQSRAGEWVLRKGAWYDEGLHAYVKRCANCRHLFLSQRAHSKTCSNGCRKERSRKLAAMNLKNGSANRSCF